MRQDRGQIALMVVLVLVVMGVVVLSVVSRTVTEVRLAAIEERSAQALRAAEAGIEEVLRTLTIGQSVSGTFGEAEYQVSSEVEGQTGFLSAAGVNEGEVIEVFLTGSPTPPTSVDIYWGDKYDAVESPTGAVEVIKYQKFAADDYRVEHLAFDPDGGRAATNNFTVAQADPGTYKDVNFAAKANVTIDPEDVMLRVRVFYNQARVGVDPLPAGSLLPDQQYKVVATGQTSDGVVRKVSAVRTLEVLSEIFDAALYSGGSLTQTQ